MLSNDLQHLILVKSNEIFWILFVDYQKQLRTGEALKYPGETEETYQLFGETTHGREIQGTSNYKGSGVLNFLVPKIGNVGTWLSSGSGLRYIAFDVSVCFLRAEDISDIVNKGKWIHGGSLEKI